jgi:DNA repair exonuclease SbcCD ATPase subunit
MVETLEKKLYVNTGEGVVVIGIEWPDAQLAYQLVETAHQNFLESRHAQEVSSIAEAISILERHAATVQESIDQAMDEVKRVTPGRTPVKAPVVTSPARRPVASQPSAGTASAAQVKALLDGKRRAIRELEDFRARRISELQAELTQQQQIYADAHPTVVRLKKSIAAMTEDSPQLTELHQEERDLATEYAQVSSTPAETELRLAAAPQVSEARRVLESSSEASAEGYAKNRLRFAMNKYDSLIARLDDARIELDTARAAFKYRYSTIRPAELPKKPIRPKVPVILALGFIAALGLAALAAALADVRSRKVVERWQVERGLGLPVLGELPRT